jgi:hypothetical protein
LNFPFQSTNLFQDGTSISISQSPIPQIHFELMRTLVTMANLASRYAKAAIANRQPAIFLPFAPLRPLPFAFIPWGNRRPF